MSHGPTQMTEIKMGSPSFDYSGSSIVSNLAHPENTTTT